MLGNLYCLEKNYSTKGMRIIIGKGNNTQMWHDPWIPEHPPRAPRSTNGDTSDVKVQTFINEGGGSWNVHKVMSEVHPEDVNKILNLKISARAELDLLGWSYNDNGIYSVKSGYWLATHLPGYNGGQEIYGNANIKQRIWKTNTTSKIKHFLWKMTSRALATGSNLQRRHIIREGQCRRCCSALETENHLFFECPYAQKIWRRSGISNSIINSPTSTFEEKIDVCLQFSTSTRLSHYQNLPIWILWRIWKSRNVLIFQQKSIHWERVIQLAQDDGKEWNLQNNDQTRMKYGNTNGRSMASRWRKPPLGWVKCNVDGSFSAQQQRSTAGWVIRDSNGTYKGAGQANGNNVNNALESELQALFIAMQNCWSKGYRKVQFENDCSKMIKILNNEVLHFTGYNWIREVNWWKSKFEDISFTWIGREGNQVADGLAKKEIPNNISFLYHHFVPNCIIHLLHYDHIRS